MVWFVLFVPAAVVLYFIDKRAIPPVESWIVVLTLLAVAVVRLKRGMRTGAVLAGITVLSLTVLFRTIR